MTPHFSTIKDLVKRQIISEEVAERLAILPDNRLGMTLATLIIDIPELEREHVDELIAAGNDKAFEKALYRVKRQISVPTFDIYAQLHYLSSMRYQGVAGSAARGDKSLAGYIAKFTVDKILTPTLHFLSLLSKEDKEGRVLTHLKRFRGIVDITLG